MIFFLDADTVKESRMKIIMEYVSAKAKLGALLDEVRMEVKKNDRNISLF